MVARKAGFIVGAVAGVGVAAAAIAGVGMRMAPAQAAESPQLVRTANAGPMIFAPPPGAPMSFADIFEKVSPAVVSIDVTSRVDARSLRLLNPFAPNGKPGEGEGEDEEQNQDEGGGRPRQQSSGSGFLISADGYIVTNNHVIEGADEITVTLKDGRELKAKLVGRDEDTDLAVIKVEGAGFTFVTFENAAKPRVGDWVIAVGNPFGLGGTATAGIVSAYGRNLNDDSSTYVDYLQIDASINRGNSGGPTFDVYGRVIGVNSAIFSPTGGSVGIGFAIPADTADAITKQLIAGGKVVRGFIGAQIQNFSPEMAQAIGLGDLKAAQVKAVTPGGPAAKAGLMVDDIVLSVNGVKVESSTALTREVGRGLAGQILRMEVLRDGQKRFIDIRAGVRPSRGELEASIRPDSEARPPLGKTPSAPGAARVQALGMGLTPLDAAGRKRFSIPSEIQGVVVESIRADSDAAERGIAVGNVITSVNLKAVRSPTDVVAAVEAARKAGRPTILLSVWFKGGLASVPVKVNEGLSPLG